MTLIVEDGTGKVNSESYASVADADAYLGARGYTDWTDLTEGQKEIALRKATDYMVQVYRLRWKGDRKTATQRLDWPRVDAAIPDRPVGYGSFSAVWPDTVVPPPVIEGTTMLALRVSQGTELSPDIEPPVTSERVASIAVTYAQGSSQIVRFREVDNVIGPLLKRGGLSSIGVARA